MFTTHAIKQSTLRLVLTRALHASPRTLVPAQTKVQASAAARQPKEYTTLIDQNPYIRQVISSKGGDVDRDRWKGNAAPEEELPSKHAKRAQVKSKAAPKNVERKEKREGRGVHTTAALRAEKHTADNYFKEVDMNPPASSKTYRVDGASGVAHRPNEQYADPKREYATVSREEPYETPMEMNGQEKPEKKEQKLEYGGMKRDAARNVPGKDEGPDKADAGGRMPEGRA